VLLHIHQLKSCSIFQGLQVDFFSLQQMTPLHVATEKRGHSSIVNYLVEKGAGINIKDDSGVST